MKKFKQFFTEKAVLGLIEFFDVDGIKKRKEIALNAKIFAIASSENITGPNLLPLL